jgi:arsenite methyltransferase
MLHEAGFVDMRIQPKDESKTFIREWVPGTNIADYLISATIEAVRPYPRTLSNEARVRQRTF